MAFRAGPAATGQQAKAIAEPGHQIRWGQGSAAGRGQLDGQRDAVQATADLLDVGAGGGRIERHADRPRPLVEQLGGRPGRVQGRHRKELFVVDAERFPGGGQHADHRAALGDGVGECGGTVDDVFAVVQDEQRRS